MDDFWSREYNKVCKKEQAECMKEVDKGIVLDDEATGQKGAQEYPTDGKPRLLGSPGCNNEKEKELFPANG